MTTVGELKKLLDQYPDDMEILSHNGRCWTDQLRIKISTVHDSFDESVEPIEPIEVLSIAGDGSEQVIWA